MSGEVGIICRSKRPECWYLLLEDSPSPSKTSSQTKFSLYTEVASKEIIELVAGIDQHRCYFQHVPRWDNTEEMACCY
ncbi:unnamed protein product [Protopolystoma xenopodis]|uniref:Uncharacterized protein n=1 Tax=Protopolystoma xenopodis TaxID=117903 RepID=A0A3S5A5I8_9PLAT|nr:unnamed protein product [Protopolystoma xenopodis]